MKISRIIIEAFPGNNEDCNLFKGLMEPFEVNIKGNRFTMALNSVHPRGEYGESYTEITLVPYKHHNGGTIEKPYRFVKWGEKI